MYTLKAIIFAVVTIAFGNLVFAEPVPRTITYHCATSEHPSCPKGYRCCEGPLSIPPRPGTTVRWNGFHRGRNLGLVPGLRGDGLEGHQRNYIIQTLFASHLSSVEGFQNVQVEESTLSFLETSALLWNLAKLVTLDGIDWGRALYGLLAFEYNSRGGTGMATSNNMVMDRTRFDNLTEYGHVVDGTSSSSGLEPASDNHLKARVVKVNASWLIRS
ncbi:hypothetical protein GYMLUDRAFT_265962 [Collybiopsis luxurians FD-317 M1]|uniref:Chitinase n=1 Tax=Collybiopsis luxurians FD-317 M1 TaxID=944289 RepID=A0A0D0ALN4_9AGAR|nr:hypothetical protein GYMLUDRAFT_265962 [Collybiopsis luxurians FD-317 M1]